MNSTGENSHPTLSPIENRTLALAGVFQVASLVKQLAKTGRVPENYFKASVESLFKIDANNVPEIYGGIPALHLGLKELKTLFTNNKDPKDTEIARYVLSLLHLERKLSKNPDMLKMIRAGIQRATDQSHHFSTLHDNVMANFASLYADTLSTFSFRIHVAGEAVYLNQTHNLNKVRTLLLAGIRAAVLWQQLGGRRWQLLIFRSSILQAANSLLKYEATADLDTVI